MNSQRTKNRLFREATLIAELITEAIRNEAGNTGVLIRDVPLDATTVLKQIRLLCDDELDLRIAYLNPASRKAAESAGIPNDIFDTSVEQAERWRNQRDLDALIVVISESDQAKLTSLEDFVLIGPKILRQLLVDRAQLKLSEVNDVLPRWWDIIRHDVSTSFSDLLDYFLALEDLDPDEVKDAAAININMLGLLPDPALFDDPNEKALSRKLKENRSLMLRLLNFSEDDRAKIDTALADEHDTTRRAKLQNHLRSLQHFRRGGEMALTASEARDLLKAKTSKQQRSRKKNEKSNNNDKSTFTQPTSLSALATRSLLSPHSGNGDPSTNPQEYSHIDDITPASLVKVVEEVARELKMLEGTTRSETIDVPLPSGEHVESKVQPDLLGMVGRMINETSYGGLARIRGDDIATMVRNFQSSAEIIKKWDSKEIAHLLEAFAEANQKFACIVEAFEQYDSARQALLPKLQQLCVEPLLLTVSTALDNQIVTTVEAYQHLVEVLQKQHTALHESYGEDTRALLESILLIDTVFLDNGSSLVALLTPIHPLLLWHYVEYTRVLTDHKDDLDDRDHKLILSELDRNGVPLFLPALGVPRIVSQNAVFSLPYAGKFGGLPQFSEEVHTNDLSDSLEPVRKILEVFVDMHPASAEGLRLALLEPPNAAQFMLVCCDLANSGKLRGAHITILLSHASTGAHLNVTTDEERQIQQRFGDHENRRFTFETVRVAEGNLSPPDGLMPHIYFAIDQTERVHGSASGAPQKIQPMANRRRLAYRLSSETLDLEPEPGGILAEYSKLAQLVVGSNIISYPSAHQAKDLRAKLRLGAKQVPWYVIVDSNIDRDLDIGSLRILTAKKRTRSVAAFARSNEAFRHSLRDVVRQFNTSVNNETLDSILISLSELLDSGLLALRPGKSGDIVIPHVQGVLGLMVAVKYLRDNAPPGFERLVLSLDSEEARRWLHLHDNADHSRADLLVIDGADGQFTVTVVEVKSSPSATSEYSVSNGIVTGRAINQMLSTQRILSQVFDPDTPELLLTPSRREVIRDHLYRELSKASYDKAARKHWVGLVRKLLDEGAPVDLRCELINVKLGVAATSLEVPRHVQAKVGDILVPVTLRYLNEDDVPELEAALAPPDPPSESSDRDTSVHNTLVNDEITKEGPAEVINNAEQSVTGPVDSSTNLSDNVISENDPRAQPRVLIGVTASSFRENREIFFDPQRSGEQLNNPHISITGETGTGKTQATKAILHELLPLGIPALILDFKDDYARPDYADPEGFTVHDASFGSLPFNPMVPPIDKMSGRVNPTTHLHELANMLQRIYGLGDQQAFNLREAMKETYAISGIGAKPFIPDSSEQYLPFETIKDVLEREKAKTLLGRLSPVFDLGLFSEGDASLTLSELLTTPTVIRLGQLPGDQVKNAVAEFFLMALHSYLMRRDQPHRLRQVLVLDEAWRLVESPFLKPLMLEGRAFGLGVIVATQFPRQLPEEVSGSTATRMFFGQTKAEQILEIQRTLVGKTKGAEADHIGDAIRSLAPLECIIQNAHYRPWERTKIDPYFARLTEKTLDE